MRLEPNPGLMKDLKEAQELLVSIVVLVYHVKSVSKKEDHVGLTLQVNYGLTVSKGFVF